MRYPIDEKTRKPYGMPKKKKAPNEDLSQEEKEAVLNKDNEDKLKENKEDVEGVDGLVKQGKDFLPKGEKPAVDAPYTLPPTSTKSVPEKPKEKETEKKK